MKRLYRKNDINEILKEYEAERDEEQAKEPEVVKDPEVYPDNADLFALIIGQILFGESTIPESEYTIPHKHKCPGIHCGTVWSHVRPPESASDEEFRRAHLCPRCGMEQRMKYFEEG